MELKERLKQARKRAGLTQADLAERAGIKQSSVSEIERGLTRTSGHLVRLAQVCGVDPVWLATGEGSAPAPDDVSNVEPGPPITSPFRAVKIVGTAQMGSEGYWCELDDGEGYVDVPSSDPNAYALRLRGDSMAPAIRSGWIAVIEPNHRLVPGEYIMIRLTDCESMLKELLYANDIEVSVMSINDAFGRRTIPIEQIESMHYVGAIVPPSKVRV